MIHYNVSFSTVITVVVSAVIVVVFVLLSNKLFIDFTLLNVVRANQVKVKLAHNINATVMAKQQRT